MCSFFVCFLRANLSIIGLAELGGVCWGALLSGSLGCWVGCLPGMPLGVGEGQRCLARGVTPPKALAFPEKRGERLPSGCPRGSAPKRGGTSVLRGVLSVSPTLSRARQGGLGMWWDAIKSAERCLAWITGCAGEHPGRCSPPGLHWREASWQRGSAKTHAGNAGSEPLFQGDPSSRYTGAFVFH